MMVRATKNSTVIIRTQVWRSIYSTASYAAQAMGFLWDVDEGIVLTNKHIVSKNLLQKIVVDFAGQLELTAKLLYDDPEHDFAILQVDHNLIPGNFHSTHMHLMPHVNILMVFYLIAQHAEIHYNGGGDVPVAQVDRALDS